MLTSIIINLLNMVRFALVALSKFLTIVTLGIIVAYPWIPRLAIVLIWLIAMYFGFTSTESIYPPKKKKMTDKSRINIPCLKGEKPS